MNEDNSREVNDFLEEVYGGFAKEEEIEGYQTVTLTQGDAIRSILAMDAEVDEHGAPISVILLQVELRGHDNSEPQVVNSLYLNTANLKFLQSPASLITDLAFPTALDPDLTRAWNLLQDYGRRNMELNEDDERFPVLTLTIMPYEQVNQLVEEGEPEEPYKYITVMYDPRFWALQPALPGEECKCIRLSFDKECVDFYETGDINFGDIDAEIRSEEDKRDLLERQREAMKKKEEEEARYRKKSASASHGPSWTIAGMNMDDKR